MFGGSVVYLSGFIAALKREAFSSHSRNDEPAGDVTPSADSEAA